MRPEKIAVFLFSLLTFIPVAAVAAESASSAPTSGKENTLMMCKDEKLAVKFLCNPDWELETKGDTMLIIISNDPAVTMTVAKSPTPLVFLEQLTRPILQEIGEYAEGFSLENATLAGQKAIKVAAYPKEAEDIRLLDYYVLREKFLYSVLFSVNPQEKWPDYAPLIKKISASFEFL